MDFKPFYLLIATIALAAGVYQGVRDAREERPAAEERGRPDPQNRQGPGDATSPGGEPGRTPDGEPGDRSRGVRPDTAPTAGEEQRLARVEKLLDDLDFSGAAREARALAGESITSARTRALRLEARALAFEALLPRDLAPAADPAAASERFEVLLANRTRLTATRVKEYPHAYELELADGRRAEVAREDVLGIERTAAPRRLAEENAALARKVEGWSDPVKIYEEGVLGFCRLGFPEEGYRLLEQLLWASESSRVPRAAAERGPTPGRHMPPEEELVRHWEIAAGLRPLPAAAGDEREPSPGDTGDTADGRQSPARLDDGSPDRDLRSAVARVNRLLGSADTLYKISFRQEGNEPQMRQALDLLRRAQAILGGLPVDDEVVELKRKVVSLMQRVNKDSPF